MSSSFVAMLKILRYLLRAVNGKDKFLIEKEALTRVVSLLLKLQEQSPDVIKVTKPFVPWALKNTSDY